MFKRLFWMGTGVAVGAGSAFWAKRKVEQTVEQYLPEQVAVRAASSAKDLAGAVRAAAAEGREAMRATEAELRARVDARTFVGTAGAGAPETGARSASGAAARPAGTRRTARATSAAGGGSAARRRARRSS